LIAQLEQRVVDLDLRCQFLETAGHDGVLLWKIGGVEQRIGDARESRIPSLYSPPFYAGRYGYKLCARVYLNGDGDGYGTHVSLFFVVMQANGDATATCLSSWRHEGHLRPKIAPREPEKSPTFETKFYGPDALPDANHAH